MRGARAIVAGAVALIAAALPARADQFRAYDVVIDPGGQTLAAYQIEIFAADRHGRIVGVEGGEHQAFSKAPYYDPAALQSLRIIVAAFSNSSDLPRQATRIATLHMSEPDDRNCSYAAKLIVATDADGNDIEARVRMQPVDGGKE